MTATRTEQLFGVLISDDEMLLCATATSCDEGLMKQPKIHSMFLKQAGRATFDERPLNFHFTFNFLFATLGGNLVGGYTLSLQAFLLPRGCTLS